MHKGEIDVLKSELYLKSTVYGVSLIEVPVCTYQKSQLEVE